MGVAGPLPDYGLLRVVTEAGPGGGGVGTQVLIDGVVANSWATTWLKMPAGTYELCFVPVPGLSTPPCATVDVTIGSVTEHTATFGLQGSLRIQTAPPQPATVFLDGVGMNDWGSWTDVDPGTHQVCFGPNLGFAPACQLATVEVGVVTDVVGAWP